MASTYSSDLKLELMTTGEKSGLALSNGAVSNGKNFYIKLVTNTGSNELTGNRIVTMPDSAERVFVVEDATNRSASLFTLTVKTVSGTGVTIPIASTNLLYSDGTNISLGIRHKGYVTPGATYTTVNGDQVLVDTSGGGIGAPVTINLPASPSVGDEVHFIDSGNNLASNNLTIGRNSSNILGSASDLVVSTNTAAFTLVYVNATRGWVYKDNI